MNPNTPKATNLSEAQDWFAKNPKGSLLCSKANGSIEKVCESLAEAQAFFGK